MKKTILALLMGSAVLVGCAPTGADLGSNVYSANQVNSRQEVSTVRIIGISPAQVAINNDKQESLAQTAGTLLGAAVGSIIGYQSSDAGAVAGGVIGGTLGAVAGNSVDGKTLVEGVTLTYQTYSEHPKTYSSTQVGRACNYQIGLARMITTKYNETRIQPNAICPVIK